LNRGIKLLQILPRAAFLGKPEQRRMQGFGPLLVRVVAIKNAHRDLLAIDDNGSSRDENIQLLSVLALALGFQHDLLPFHQ
jgi:hypothetical protein